jgi:hypothetical protein
VAAWKPASSYSEVRCSATVRTALPALQMSLAHCIAPMRLFGSRHVALAKPWDYRRMAAD